MNIVTEDGCKWHEGEEPVDWEENAPGCQGCGRLYTTKECPNCHKEFLDFETDCYDDVVAAPFVTSSGDLYCAFCGPAMEAEEERMYDDE